MSYFHTVLIFQLASSIFGETAFCSDFLFGFTGACVFDWFSIEVILYALFYSSVDFDCLLSLLQIIFYDNLSKLLPYVLSLALLST